MQGGGADGRGVTAADAVERALVELMAERPFSAISVKELCGRAHVSRVSFYRNFASKEDVLRRHLQKRMQAVVPASSVELPDAEVRVRLAQTLTSLQRDADFLGLLRANGLLHLVYELFLREGSSYIRRFQPAAVPYQDTYYTGGTVLVILRWIERGMPERPEELAGILDTLYYRRNFG